MGKRNVGKQYKDTRLRTPTFGWQLFGLFRLDFNLLAFIAHAWNNILVFAKVFAWF